MIKNNYHTHTQMCGHATGNVSDYVLEAVKNGFDVIGISDHGITPRGFLRPYMDEAALKYYLEEIDAAKKEFPQIKILKGLENEFFRNNDSFYRNLLSKLDYLILGVHYYNDDMSFYQKSSFKIKNQENLLKYRDLAVKGIESGFFKIIAHPDVFMMEYPSWDETAIQVSNDIINACIKHNVLIEVNAQGIRKGKRDEFGKPLYPNENFFKIVKEKNARVIIGSDCHRPTYLNDESFKAALEFAQTLGLKVEEELKL